jgi:hypothetical protein
MELAADCPRAGPLKATPMLPKSAHAAELLRARWDMETNWAMGILGFSIS